MKLADACNTWDIVVYTIQKKGYKMHIEYDDEKEVIAFYVAEKGNKQIYGDTPLAILALIVIAEEYGEKWNTVDTGKAYSKLLDI